MALLELKEVTKNFGGLTALNKVTFGVDEGSITGLIGPNGSGKTTLINVVSGFYKPTSGKIMFGGHDITGSMMHDIARRGICRGFQLTNVFREFSVLDNVRAAFYLHTGVGFWGAAFHTRGVAAKEKEVTRKAMEIIDFLQLSDVKDDLAVNLPHGSERLLGLAMTLATGAKMLMLDEPATGMNLAECALMMDKIKEIRNRGKTVLVIEHNMRFISGLCDRIVVLDFGQKICEGVPAQVLRDPKVCEAYLGLETASA